MKEQIKNFQKLTYAQIDATGMRIRHKKQHDLLEVMKSQHEEVIQNYNRAKEALKKVVDEAKEKRKQAIDEIQSHHINYDESNENFYQCEENGVPPKSLREEIWPQIPDDKDILMAEIDELSNEISATANVRDRSVIEEFNETKSNFEKASKKLLEFKKNATEGQKHLQNQIDEWFASVKTVVTKIDFHFQKLMKDMRCDGGVEIQNTSDFKKIGIQINVKFREGEAITALSPGSNSGGERAVSTIMYLLAVQQLTSAPLRMVDEINQGMDANNEKHCYNAVGNICSTEQGKTQFWLFSPKLLMNEKRFHYPHDITVLLVHGGANMPSSDDWNLQDIIDAERKKKSRGVKAIKKRKSSSSSTLSQNKKQKKTGGKKRG
jgi:chromosome segregation ATPase